MRVRMLRGAKHVTLIGDGHSNRVIRSVNLGSSTADMKFTMIDKQGVVTRGLIELPLGPIKKESKYVRPLERRVRRMVRRQYRALGRYLVLHDQSRRRKRNGWVKDLDQLKSVIRSLSRIKGSLGNADTDPDLESIRDDPRFQKMLSDAKKRLGIESKASGKTARSQAAAG